MPDPEVMAGYALQPVSVHHPGFRRSQSERVDKLRGVAEDGPRYPSPPECLGDRPRIIDHAMRARARPVNQPVGVSVFENRSASLSHSSVPALGSRPCLDWNRRSRPRPRGLRCLFYAYMFGFRYPGGVGRPPASGYPFSLRGHR